MKAAGAVGVATGRRWIASSGVMSRLFAYANAFDLPIIVHAEDGGLADGAAATAGETATRLGIPSAPSVAEALGVARDLMHAEQAGARSEARRVGKVGVSTCRLRWGPVH